MCPGTLTIFRGMFMLPERILLPDSGESFPRGGAFHDPTVTDSSTEPAEGGTLVRTEVRRPLFDHPALTSIPSFS